MEELLRACKDLLANQLSTSSGDMGMIFDEFDVERKRKGTVTFDREAVDRRFKAAVEKAES